MRKALLIPHDAASVDVECSYCRTVLRTVRRRAAGDLAPTAEIGTLRAEHRLQWEEECPTCGTMNEVFFPLQWQVQRV